MSAASFAPRSWTAAGSSLPLAPACLHTPTGWSCACPASATADLSSADGPEAGAAFSLHLSAGPRPGVLRVGSTGCHRLGGDCRPGTGGARPPATARSEILLALHPALPSVPGSALTVRDPGIGADGFFAAQFGIARPLWKRQAVVQRPDCRSDCGARIAEAAARGATMFAIEGDLLLQGPLSLGTAERPLLIVADGAIRLQGAVVLHGVLYGNGLSWGAPSAVVRGALISEGTATGDSSLDLARDAAVLDALHTRQGLFVRLPGSWRDF